MIRTDFYTKAVLTVIAFCLLVLCFQSLRSPAPAYAQGASQRVIVTGVDPQVFKSAIPVFISGGSVPVPVTIIGASKPVPVEMSK